jgi:hypothetical protein
LFREPTFNANRALGNWIVHAGWSQSAAASPTADSAQYRA